MSVRINILFFLSHSLYEARMEKENRIIVRRDESKHAQNVHTTKQKKECGASWFYNFATTKDERESEF